ncbi:hypothetical protein F5X97DRAFT_295120 [Nemania serpens]|nr:hypothetical protein F5X97DRAFT_295120 [Nemania serpens]
MDSLRKQLGDTQGALHDRDKKFRQLRADHNQAIKSWADEKSALESTIARLEAENLRLNGTHKVSAISSAQKDMANRLILEHTPDADGGDTVTITRSRMKQAEAQFGEMFDALEAKNKMCQKLEAKLAQSSPAAIVGLTDDQVTARWNQLRDQIRTLSLDYLNKPFLATSVTKELQAEFEMISPHWKTYANTPNMTYYLFRALIWRYILRYFQVPCRAWGRDISKKIGEIAEPLSKKVPDAEYQEWCIRTAVLIGKTFPIDKDFIDETTTKLIKSTMPFAGEKDPVALKAALRNIVTATAELGAAFDQSRFVVLMFNEPGSTLMHGFPFADNVMDMRAKLGSQGVVDLMITPSLLKKEGTYSLVVKAEVIC